MRFVVDAHLPKQMVRLLRTLGHEAIHTHEMADGNASSDEAILQEAGAHGIVISKDVDFYHSFLVQGKPSKLILVKVGNMRLRAVMELFSKNLDALIDLMKQHDLVELHADKIIVVR